MGEILGTANERLLLWLNGWLSSDAALYQIGLILTDKFADMLVLLTLALLWFWPDPKSDSLFSSFARGTQRAQSTHWARRLVQGPEYLSREQSRAQVLAFGTALMLGYIMARLIALRFDVPRPFVTYLPVRSGVEGAFDDLRTFGSFPSDHAVLLAGLPVALSYWNRFWCWIWTGLAIVLALTRVAVGFHYPSDMVGGALIGVVMVASLMGIYRSEGQFYRSVNSLANGFDRSNAPYCYILYALLALVGLEFAMHLQHVLGAIFKAQAEISVRSKGWGF